jgi:DNA-binding NarL/FixJ family response regulator
MAAVVGVVVLSEGCRRLTRALRAGARGYVAKRSSAERLMEAIRAVATGGTLLRSLVTASPV